MNRLNLLERISYAVGVYGQEVSLAIRRAPILSVVTFAGWVLTPPTLLSFAHPFDALGLPAWLMGRPIPHDATVRALQGGMAMAAIEMVVLGMIEFGAITLFFRRAQFTFHLWPIPAVLLGVFGNAIWAINDYYDAETLLSGFTPVVVTVGVTMILEKLGKDFVFGAGNRPRLNPAGG